VIEYPETITMSNLQRSITDRSQVDHTLITNIEKEVMRSHSNPVTVTSSEVDHISDAQGGGVGVNQPQNAEAPEFFKVGDRVFWDHCPGYCASLNPFTITAIEGDYAMLDFMATSVPLTALRFEQGASHE
jgi:hypothetical protein